MRAPDPEGEEELAGAVRRATIDQLLGGGPFVELVHVACVLFVAVLIWNLVPHPNTIIWVVAITAGAVARSWWRVYARRRQFADEKALAGVRLTVLMVGLAWGFIGWQPV